MQVQSLAPGYRTHDLNIVTTLLDPVLHRPGQIAAGYRRRWQVELYFDDIKTSLCMDTLRCKNPHTIARELLMNNNLIRHLLISAEPLRDLTARDALSFKGTMDRLDHHLEAHPMPPTPAAATPTSSNPWPTTPVPKRPGRKEPCVCKDRQNKYTLMTKPRHSYGPQDDLAHAA